MKKPILLSITLLLSLQIAMARKVVVTSSADNENAPTSGMLRYFINNAQSNDTIVFNVAKVNLLAELRITSSMVIDGGLAMATIDGGGYDRIFNISSYSSTTKISIKNLKIVNGKLSDDYGFGGGMYVFVSSGDVTVDKCIFSNNEAIGKYDAQGGALRNQGGMFTNCTFLNNKVSGTAGPQGGGGVQAVSGQFVNCVFSGNKAKWGGGVYASDAMFYNCTFTNNIATATDGAGGIESEDSEFVNCIAYKNTANGKVSNIIALGTSKIKYTAMEAGNSLVGTDGNIGLTSSPFKGGNNADSLSLTEGPLVNAGTSTGITVLSTDILGNKRISGSAIDLGAYEFGASLSINDTPFRSNIIGLYPNPSTGTIYFNQELLQSQNFEAEVYDLLGNLVLKHSQINAPMVIENPGIFQVKIKSGSTVYSQKVVIE